MKYFTEKELRCPCCEQIPPRARENIVALVNNVLDPVRELYGKPIYVTSGYRCYRHNLEVGGVKNSQHMQGEAADIHCDDNQQLIRLIKQLGTFDQLIVYPTFLHVSYKRPSTGSGTEPNRHRILRKVANGYDLMPQL